MGFDDIAKRMKDRRGVTRAERLEAIWTGEEPKLPPLAPPPEPVAPAKRTRTIVAAYAVLFAGMLVTMAGGIVTIVWFTSTTPWEHRGLYFVIAIGISLVIKATRLFDAVAKTAPLPGARLRE